MSFFKSIYLRFKIRNEVKRLNSQMDILANKVKENPNLGYEEISEENKALAIDVVTKIIDYKTQLGESAPIEKKFLRDLQENKLK